MASAHAKTARSISPLAELLGIEIVRFSPKSLKTQLTQGSRVREGASDSRPLAQSGPRLVLPPSYL
jgi:hypothetical protein